MLNDDWSKKVIYQIFPRSFYDSNNDGNGDIQGIASKIPYLKQLGVDAIWLCPIYDTEFADAGYDVLDYKSIWEQFGTIEHFRELSSICKENGIEIIMDIVLNHVSSAHPWFKKAIESADNPEHEYFIWRKKLTTDEKKAKSIFGGSAWEYVPSVNKYYFHLFAKEQVDLNWENEGTLVVMADIINFWYELGVRGFRLDAIKHVAKDFPEGNEKAFSWGEKAVKYLKNFNKEAFSDKDDVFIFGESSGITLKEAIKYGITKSSKVSNNFFNFAWWNIGWSKKTGRNGLNTDWEPKTFYETMKPFQESKVIQSHLLTNFITNHDTGRAISRWGDENVFWQEAAKSFALFLFSLKGIPCIYYGDEIGMLNPGFRSKNEFKDVDALNAFVHYVDKDKVYTEDELVKYHSINSRDNSRTPMQWNSKVNSGFNDGKKPWIKVGETYKRINVTNQINDPNSIFTFYKKIIELRKSSSIGKTLLDGESTMSISANGIIKIQRIDNKNVITTFINLSRKKLKFKLQGVGKLLASSYVDNKKVKDELRPFESVMLSISRTSYNKSRRV